VGKYQVKTMSHGSLPDSYSMTENSVKRPKLWKDKVRAKGEIAAFFDFNQIFNQINQFNQKNQFNQGKTFVFSSFPSDLS
jgi:hypothetical protein